MRALLDLMREKEERVQSIAAACEKVLEAASQNLTILDPEVGEEELIKSWAAALAKLRS